eukprot:6197749-Pleurochrysis_carterae.AAC.2
MRNVASYSCERARAMAEPASGRAGAMFSVGARQATAAATAALQLAVREARKALEAVGSGKSTLPPPVTDWLTLDAKSWERQGMLTAFRMRGGGVLFTLGRDVGGPTRVAAGYSCNCTTRRAGT